MDVNVKVGSGVWLGEEVKVGREVCVGVNVGDRDGVNVKVGVKPAVGVADCVGVNVSVIVGRGLRVGSSVAVGAFVRGQSVFINQQCDNQLNCFGWSGSVHQSELARCKSGWCRCRAGGQYFGVYRTGFDSGCVSGDECRARGRGETGG